MSEKKIKDRIYSVLTSTQSITRDIFDHEYIKKILVDKKTFEFSGDSRKYQSSLASTVWMCYNLELFLSKKN
jgi:hypothetical protein